MNTLIKVVIGTVIGAMIGVLGTWLLLSGASVKEPETELTSEKVNNSLPAEKARNAIVEDTGKANVSISSEGLEGRVEVLERELQLKKQQLEAAETNKNKAIEKLNSYSTNSKERGRPWSNEEKPKEEAYLEDVPETHQGLINPPKVKTTYDRHKDFVDETEDIGWSLEKEQQITSFIQGHPRGAEINLQLVKCKRTTCEVYGSSYSQDGKALSIIGNDMRSQPWWDFAGSSISSNSDGDGQQLFMIILHSKS
ncbi:hypothetical protein DZA50_01420 [Kangiella sp. HD9-110m-PIT-SAG07]|nr:hypothetical protein DZA50_01420 [Kangiella sp. HD9-110m-PIT-SAG07]